MELSAHRGVSNGRIVRIPIGLDQSLTAEVKMYGLVVRALSLVPSTSRALAVTRLAKAFSLPSSWSFAQMVTKIGQLVKTNPITAMLVAESIIDLAPDAIKPVLDKLGEMAAEYGRNPDESARLQKLRALVDTDGKADTPSDDISRILEEERIIRPVAAALGGISVLLNLRKALALSDQAYVDYVAMRG